MEIFIVLAFLVSVTFNASCINTSSSGMGIDEPVLIPTTTHSTAGTALVYQTHHERGVHHFDGTPNAVRQEVRRQIQGLFHGGVQYVFGSKIDLTLSVALGVAVRVLAPAYCAIGARHAFDFAISGKTGSHVMRWLLGRIHPVLIPQQPAAAKGVWGALSLVVNVFVTIPAKEHVANYGFELGQRVEKAVTSRSGMAFTALSIKSGISATRSFFSFAVGVVRSLFSSNVESARSLFSGCASQIRNGVSDALEYCTLPKALAPDGAAEVQTLPFIKKRTRYATLREDPLPDEDAETQSPSVNGDSTRDVVAWGVTDAIETKTHSLTQTAFTTYVVGAILAAPTIVGVGLSRRLLFGV